MGAGPAVAEFPNAQQGGGQNADNGIQFRVLLKASMRGLEYWSLGVAESSQPCSRLYLEWAVCAPCGGGHAFRGTCSSKVADRAAHGLAGQDVLPLPLCLL